MMEGGMTMLEFNGFDIYAMVKRNGIMLPNKADAGSISFNGKMYGFASSAAAAQFSAAPEAFLAAAMETVRARPEIIHLAGLAQAFPTVDISPIIEMTSAPVSCDFGTQTPTHFVEKNMDKDYEWNEWALRRRALSLANLRQKKTHGAQSILSHFRRETETQVWLPKAAATQSASAKGTAMPQKKRYIGGLRGGPEVKMNVVSLELDVGQPHEY